MCGQKKAEEFRDAYFESQLVNYIAYPVERQMEGVILKSGNSLLFSYKWAKFLFEASSRLKVIVLIINDAKLC